MNDKKQLCRSERLCEGRVKRSRSLSGPDSVSLMVVMMRVAMSIQGNQDMDISRCPDKYA